MTPARAIAMLDRQIGAHGQLVTLRRVVANAGPVVVAVSAFVRGYRPDELVAGIEQGDTLVTISPSALAGTPFAAAMPESGDRIEIDGRPRRVQMVDPVMIAGTLVRLNLMVKG